MLDALTDALLGRMNTRTKQSQEYWRGKAGTPGTTASQNYLHGPGSLLGVLGLPQQITNAMILPLRGLQGVLPYFRSDFENELFTILTGQTASTGTEPTANCEDGTQPGQLENCNTIWPFGRLVKDSQVLDVSLTNRLINRGEFVDPVIVGNPFADLMPQPPVSPQNALKDDVSKKLVEMAISFFRDYGHLVFDGNPANTASSSGGYIEYNGLARIVNNAYQDVVSQTACPAANSLIRAFGGLTMDANAQTLVTEISEMIRYIDYTAERTGQGTLKDGTLELALVMRYSAFLRLTEVWPCAYFTTMCTNLNTGSTQFVDAQRQIDLRNEMRAGSYVLTIFGHQIPVIIDDFMTETLPVSGTFQSDIYCIPLKTNGKPVTYFQFFNWDGPAGAVEQGNMMSAPGTFTTWGEGQYLLIKKPVTNTCVQVEGITKKRLVCEAPFLAGRLTNVRYVVVDHERVPGGGTPTGYGYELYGGTGYNTAPYNYPAVYN